MFFAIIFKLMSIKKPAIILGLLLICSGVFSQTQITGIVKDTKGHPVPGASISIKNSFDGATSDSLGKYSFSSSDTGIQTLKISSVGYRSIEVTLQLYGKLIQLEDRKSVV